MARFYPIGAAGGGAGSDDCTGTVDELLKGYTAVLKGSGDEPVQGKLELTGDAQEGNVLAGSTFYNTDPKTKRAGTMPNREGYCGWGNSKGNDGGNQRMWVRLPGGYYNENAEVYLSWADIRAMAGITPERIKKNESIMGIIGSFEGWVPTPQDLYYNGVNVGGLTLEDMSFNSEHIAVGTSKFARIRVPSRSYAGYRNIILDCDLTYSEHGYPENRYSGYISVYLSDKEIAYLKTNGGNTPLNYKNITLPIDTTIANSGVLDMRFYPGYYDGSGQNRQVYLTGKITRIRLS